MSRRHRSSPGADRRALGGDARAALPAPDRSPTRPSPDGPQPVAPAAASADAGRGSVEARRQVAVALLPIRFFFGATFLYAGLDKLLDPRFLDAVSPTSIQAQMVDFIRVSPIAPLVRLGEPLAVPIGIGIALLEIAIGLAALTGLAFRAAAAAGAGLSLLFFLTASWATRPYYFGADLPYATGWISLAVAGHGGLLVPRRLLAWAGGLAGGVASPVGRAGSPARGGRAARRPRPGAAAADSASLPIRDRRTVLQAGVLGVFALVVASLAVPFRRVGAGTSADEEGSPSGSRSALGSGAPSSPAASVAAGSPAASSAFVVAHVADLAKTGAQPFTVPFAAPAPFPSGDPGVIVRLADGSFVAYDAVCTHAGCTVEWDRADRLLFCPCHGAAFDPAARAAVVGDGPTNQPLASIPIVVDAASGAISLAV